MNGMEDGIAKERRKYKTYRNRFLAWFWSMVLSLFFALLLLFFTGQ